MPCFVHDIVGELLYGGVDGDGVTVGGGFGVAPFAVRGLAACGAAVVGRPAVALAGGAGCCSSCGSRMRARWGTSMGCGAVVGCDETSRERGYSSPRPVAVLRCVARSDWCATGLRIAVIRSPTALGTVLAIFGFSTLLMKPGSDAPGRRMAGRASGAGRIRRLGRYGVHLPRRQGRPRRGCPTGTCRGQHGNTGL